MAALQTLLATGKRCPRLPWSRHQGKYRQPWIRIPMPDERGVVCGIPRFGGLRGGGGKDIENGGSLSRVALANGGAGPFL